jgi:glycosyltransferase involved in cell wall biosynthesis
MTRDAAHICFVAPTAYAAITGDHSTKRIGGAQVQQAIVARELAARGYRVSMICMDHGQASPLNAGGVTIYKAYRPTGGLPLVRFLWPRLSSIWRCMKQVNADIYYYRAAGMLAGVVAAFAKLNGKKSVYAAAGDPDLEPNTSRVKHKRDRLLFEYGLRTVDEIIVQNPRQKALCIRHYHRDPVLINNCWPAPTRAVRPGRTILWVSMMRGLKQPHLFLELARSLPNYQFRMVGGHKEAEKALFEAMKSKAERIPNLDFLGYVPLNEIDELFDDARVFVNTSESEGFPNTFLQAWSRGIPTLSFVDCGARSSAGPIGVVVSTIEGMREALERLMTDDAYWKVKSDDSLRHFAAHHSPRIVIPQYETVIRTLLAPNDFRARGDNRAS